MTEQKANPVVLLRDEKGVYGIGLNDQFPFDQPPFGIRHESWGTVDRRPKTRPLILRPDKFPEGEALHYSDKNARLQMLPPRAGVHIAGTLEQQFGEIIAQFILHRCGVTDSWGGEEAPKEERDAQRRKYHGTNRIAGKIINRMIFQVIEQGADPEAIRVARRFHPTYREAIYRQIATNPRLLQLAETFPMLTLYLFTGWAEHYQEEGRARQAEAIRLVNQGASLKRVATVMDLPIHLRRLKPGILLDSSMPCTNSVLRGDPKLLRAYLPGTTVEARRWLMAVYRAEQKEISLEFVRWVARNAHHFPAGRYEPIPPPYQGPRRFWCPARVLMKNLVDDLADFVRACKRKEGHVIHPFCESMSFRTVTRLSTEWHKAVQDTNGPQYTFPPPWYPDEIVAGYEFVPLTSSTDLYQEGAAMHNCVGTYGEQVMDGDCYIYSIRQAGERVATLEIVKGRDGKVGIGQLRNTCNKSVSPEIEFVAREWLARMQALPELDKAA